MRQAAWKNDRGAAIMRYILGVSVLIVALAVVFGVAAPTLPQAQTISTALDANGWTVFTPSASTRIVYVSSSTGNDSTGIIGDINHPYKTIAKGLSLLRKGYPDWLLLKKGDAWTESNQITTSGRSATEPVVISSYDPAYPGVVNPSTTGARPLVNVATSLRQSAFYSIGSIPASGNYLAIVGIELYACDRDPNNTSNPYGCNYNASTVDSGLSGITLLMTFSSVLIEDCKISFFNNNLTIQGYDSPSANLILRRNVVTDAYGISTGSHSMSSGMFINAVNNVILEENLFDHNGWNATVTNAGATVFNHNVYIAGVSGGKPTTVSVAAIKGNIFSNDSSGSQFRSGGTIDNNLFVSNPYPHNIGAPIAGGNYITNNVYLQGFTGLGTGWGPSTMESIYHGYNYNVGTVTFYNNIVANAHSSTSGISVSSGFSGTTIANNIIFNWRNPIVDNGTGTVITNNNQDANGTNTNPGGLAPAEPFPDPTRSVGSYYATLGLGGTALLTDFLSAARRQSKGNWNKALMAAAVNNYVRTGFGITSTPTLSRRLLHPAPR
jgi:hypothetical protein